MPRGKEKVCACHGHHGWKMLVLGLLVLANTYWAAMSWDYFLGGVLTLGGLLKMLMPCKCK